MKQRMFGMITLALVLVSMLTIPQGFASKTSPVSHPYARQTIQAVSNPSGDCNSLGLMSSTEYHGQITIAFGRLSIYLMNANPRSVYTVSLGYRNGNAGCAGTWQPLGSISTDAAGNGQLTMNLGLKGHRYVVELRDGQSNITYATSFLAL